MLDKVSETCYWGAIRSGFDNNLGRWIVSLVAFPCRAILAASVLDCVGGSDLLISLDIESVSNGFGNGQTEVECATGGYGAESVDDSPRFVERVLAVGSAGSDLEGVLEADGAEEGDEGGGELAEALVSKHGGHHCTSPFDGRELGGDDSRQGVVSSNTCAEYDPPEDHHSDDTEGGASPGQGECKGCKDDDHELDSVHLPSALPVN